MPADDYTSDNSSIQDILKINSKRLSNLETKFFFPSPEFEQNLKDNSNREINAAAIVATRSFESADNASKSAIAAAAACKSVLNDNEKIAALQRKNASIQNETWLHTVGRRDALQAVMTDSDCPASPEHIRPFYGTNIPRQYPNINVPSCLATTRIQSTRYPHTPLS